MCNAHNHPPGCTCGWGGDGHLGTHGGGDHYGFLVASYPHFETLRSFTDPNARCPVCGAPVFFYRSPDGGRVFFDELGPPWPKHPCTDNAEPYWWTPTSVGELGTGTYAWQANGWQPIFDVEVSEIARGLYRISATGNSPMHFLCADPTRVAPYPAFAFVTGDSLHTSICMYSLRGGSVQFQAIAKPAEEPPQIRLEKVRSNVYRFSEDELGHEGYFRSSCARLHKPQPAFGEIIVEASRLTLWWTDSDPKQFRFYDSVEEALVANAPVKTGSKQLRY